jgi:HupE / UreJ protein
MGALANFLSATWADAVGQFLRHGAVLVFTSADFLLFLFCLTLPFRNYRDFFPAVVAFGGALSVALLTAIFGLAPDALWFNPLIETLAAVAILLAAFANIAGRVTPRRRALLALGAGFVFGFSCSFEFASKAQFAGSHAITAALAFDAGALFAAALMVAVMLPVISFLFSFARTENVERIIVSALVADTAWSWLDERWARLSKVPMQLVFDAGVLAVTLRCLAVLVLVGGLLWFVNEWLKSRPFAQGESSSQQKSRTAV